MNKLKVIVAATFFGLSSVAAADRGPSTKYEGHGIHHDRYEYAKVIDVKPIYREVRISEPVEECWQEPVRHRIQHSQPSAGGLLAGGIVGGIIGHQLGKKSKHRGFTTAMGTLVGAKIGHDAVNSGQPHGHYSEHVEMHQTCSQYERVSYRQEIDAYDVTYRYQGRKYQIEMPYDPGKRIKMRIQVVPVI